MHRNKKNQNPFLLKRAKVALFITALACCLSYFFIDIPLAEYFEHISTPLKIVSNALTEMIDPIYQYFIWPILYFAFRLIWRNDFLANRCLVLVMSIPLTNVVIGLIKALMGRPRPELFFSLDLYGFTFFKISNTYQSFPSGHAGTIGADCGAFSCFYPKATLPLIILAFILALTRVTLTYHFFSDTLAGTMIGILISQWIYTKNNILTIRGT